jgi:ribosomal protein S18 acetylase RimI-like enzyme
VQTLADLKKEFATKIILRAVLEGQLAGSVRAGQKEATCFIEKLIVHPDLQGRGIGTKLMREIETLFPKVKRFELFTGHRSERNIRLYNKLGYQAFKEQRINDNLSLTYMEKSINR